MNITEVIQLHHVWRYTLIQYLSYPAPEKKQAMLEGLEQCQLCEWFEKLSTVLTDLPEYHTAYKAHQKLHESTHRVLEKATSNQLSDLMIERLVGEDSLYQLHWQETVTHTSALSPFLLKRLG